ncbi:hypothetical protein Leryth_016545 [Lithospermum erythrorhizon]|nr:hypothetical protein Leryth_016545 [Lithospermum erythrorhizon]
MGLQWLLLMGQHQYFCEEKEKSQKEPKREIGRGCGIFKFEMRRGIVNNLLVSFNLKQLDTFNKATGDRDLVDRILLVFDLLRRKIAQYEESKEALPSAIRQPNMKASKLLSSGQPALSPGHMTHDGNDGGMLIYTDSVWTSKKDGQTFDQKLEGGNLALEKSRHRGNEIRVIRGLKGTGKIYIYDGLYKFQETWVDKNITGCNIFKYQLIRLPGQPEAFTIWNLSGRSYFCWAGAILPQDLTSGSEHLPPVSLTSGLYSLSEPFLSCTCLGECQSGDVNCPASKKNEGFLLIASLRGLVELQLLVHEKPNDLASGFESPQPQGVQII